MTQQHTIHELANDRELWAKYIDPFDVVPFDDYTQDQRERIIRQSFPFDFYNDGKPIDAPLDLDTVD